MYTRNFQVFAAASVVLQSENLNLNIATKLLTAFSQTLSYVCGLLAHLIGVCGMVDVLKTI